MKHLKRAGKVTGIVLGLYLFLPLLIFDFTSLAYSSDEEYHASGPVAIGPRPYWWVPRAAWKLDIPGGFSYNTSGWPFVVWRPLCLVFLKLKGYVPPREWRD